MIVLIPSYKPDSRLLQTIGELRSSGVDRIVVVDDGGGAEFAPIFDDIRSQGITVLIHETNKGKGRAMKTGFRYVLDTFPGEGVVIADDDGQHLCKDIIAVGKKLEEFPEAMILGTRQFVGDVPMRSQLGNSITRAVFLWATGRPVSDTQTGLRGIPALLLEDIIAMRGERYDLEMNMLLSFAKRKICFKQVPIETVYFDGNRGSHFKTLPDSFRIYRIITKFSIVSIIATFIDIGVFMLLAACWAWASGGVWGSIWPVMGCVAGGRLAAFFMKRLGQKAHIFEWKDELIKLISYTIIIYFFNIVWGMDLLLARILASSIVGACFMIVLNEMARRENIYEKNRFKSRQRNKSSKAKVGGISKDE
ncbi:MAG: glycosyltransferase family 2 protein [Christensenellales bacterium]|jgi:glycosyltransferase involved in cell wall biosynthesis